MAWLCEDCKWENADKWDNCAHCGKPSGIIRTPPTKEEKNFKFFVILLLCIFAILVLLIFATIAESMPKPTPTLKTSNQYQAHQICSQFIEKLLKAPSTAQFESMFDSEYNQLSKDQFEVWLYVDAQNSFGAMLRNDYYCKVTYLPELDKWYLDDLVNYDE